MAIFVPVILGCVPIRLIRRTTFNRDMMKKKSSGKPEPIVAGGTTITTVTTQPDNRIGWMLDATALQIAAPPIRREDHYHGFSIFPSSFG